MIYAEVLPEAYDNVTVEEILEVMDFVDLINELEADGYIRIENINGEPRIYPI